MAIIRDFDEMSHREIDAARQAVRRAVTCMISTEPGGEQEASSRANDELEDFAQHDMRNWAFLAGYATGLVAEVVERLSNEAGCDPKEVWPALAAILASIDGTFADEENK